MRERTSIHLEHPPQQATGGKGERTTPSLQTASAQNRLPQTANRRPFLRHFFAFHVFLIETVRRLEIAVTYRKQRIGPFLIETRAAFPVSPFFTRFRAKITLSNAHQSHQGGEPDPFPLYPCGVAKYISKTMPFTR